MKENTLLDNYAPVLIITLNRFEHFKCCVESLSKCTHADKTDLYIALDYPLKESHWEGYKKIKEYIDKIDGFKSTIVIERNENYGMLKNYSDAIQIVLSKHERFIFSEDDNEFSPNFLAFINKGLEKFKDDKSITAICGYNYPLEISSCYNYNFYYYKTFSAWGYGMWRDRYKEFYYSPEELEYFAKNYKYLFRAYQMAEQKPLSILNSIRKNQPLYGDGVVSLENIKYNRYCIFPVISKVRNRGHDGTGLHCSKMEDDFFLTQHIDAKKEFYFSEDTPIEHNSILNSLTRYFSISLSQKIKTIVLYIKFISQSFCTKN